MIKTLTQKTAKLLCFRADSASEDVTLEAQKLYDLYNDPDVPADVKEFVHQKLEKLVQDLEGRAQTTRRTRGTPPEGGPAAAPAV